MNFENFLCNVNFGNIKNVFVDFTEIDFLKHLESRSAENLKHVFNEWRRFSNNFETANR